MIHRNTSKWKKVRCADANLHANPKLSLKLIFHLLKLSQGYPKAVIKKGLRAPRRKCADPRVGVAIAEKVTP